jgi:hypothetical protein
MVLLAMTAGGVVAAEQQHVLPARFQGELNVQKEHCGTWLNDSQLRIYSDHIWFNDSAGPIRAVVTLSVSNLAVAV